MSKAIIATVVLLLMTFSKAGGGEQWTQFRGTHYPTPYLNRLLVTVSSWSSKDRDLFLRRAIEGAKWLESKPGLNNQVIRSQAQMDALARHFPSLRGAPLEKGTARAIGELLAKEHLSVARSISSGGGDRRRFQGTPSPSFLLERKYESKRNLTDSEWRQVKALIREGAKWESQNPDLDYAIGTDENILRLIKRRLPGFNPTVSVLGVSVRDIARAVALGEATQQGEMGARSWHGFSEGRGPVVRVDN